MNYKGHKQTGKLGARKKVKFSQQSIHKLIKLRYNISIFEEGGAYANKKGGCQSDQEGCNQEGRCEEAG